VTFLQVCRQKHAVNDIQDVDLNTALIATGTSCLTPMVVEFDHELSVGKL